MRKRLLKRVKAFQLKPLSKIVTLSLRNPIVQGQASLLLKSPYKVNFIANEAVMHRSTATASFKVQKGKSYVVKVNTQMRPDKRSRNVSLDLKYVLGGEGTSINLSKTAKSNNLEAYQFQVVLLADGNGYVNLDIQRDENSGRWSFSKIEVQEVGF